jgi:hypothetical protein
MQWLYRFVDPRAREVYPSGRVRTTPDRIQRDAVAVPIPGPSRPQALTNAKISVVLGEMSQYRRSDRRSPRRFFGELLTSRSMIASEISPWRLVIWLVTHQNHIFIGAIRETVRWGRRWSVKSRHLIGQIVLWGQIAYHSSVYGRNVVTTWHCTTPGIIISPWTPYRNSMAISGSVWWQGLDSPMEKMHIELDLDECTKPTMFSDLRIGGWERSDDRVVSDVRWDDPRVYGIKYWIFDEITYSITHFWIYPACFLEQSHPKSLCVLIDGSL